MVGANCYMIGFIRSLQMIIHLPMLMIIMPANVSAFFCILIPIATFDVLDSGWTTELIFEFDEAQHERLEPEIYDQTETLGYETHNALLNLGSLAIFSFTYYVRLLFLFLVLRKIPYFEDYKARLFKMLIFGEIVSISVEGYFEFLISGIMQVKYPLTTTNGEKVSICFGYYSLAVSTILVPGVLFYVFTRNMDIIKQKVFQEKWGALFEGVRLKSKFQSFFMGVFVIRRALFVSIALFLPSQPCFQV